MYLRKRTSQYVGHDKLTLLPDAHSLGNSEVLPIISVNEKMNNQLSYTLARNKYDPLLGLWIGSEQAVYPESRFYVGEMDS